MGSFIIQKCTARRPKSDALWETSPRPTTNTRRGGYRSSIPRREATDHKSRAQAHPAQDFSLSSGDEGGGGEGGDRGGRPGSKGVVLFTAVLV